MAASPRCSPRAAAPPCAARPNAPRVLRRQRPAPAGPPLAHVRRRSVADPWREADNALTVAVVRPSGTTRVSQTVPPRRWVCPPAVRIRTGNDPCRVRRQGEATRLVTLLERRTQRPGLGRRATVPHALIRMARPGLVRKPPVPPVVPHIMEPQVGPHGTAAAAWRRPRRLLAQRPVRPLPRGVQPSFDVPPPPFAVGMMRDRPSPQRVSAAVQERWDGVLHPPVGPPAPRAGDGPGRAGRGTGSLSRGVRMALGCHEGRQRRFGPHRRHAVPHRRHPEAAWPAVLLR